VPSLPQVFFSIFMAAFGAAQAQAFFPDVAKGKAATQRVFAIIDRKPRINASSEVGLRLAACCDKGWRCTSLLVVWRLAVCSSRQPARSALQRT
jgi:hypothetical protein